MKSNAMHTRNMINTTSKQARGFTLIDMLVSLAIMTLLIATLLPALAEARRASKRAVCMTHEHCGSRCEQITATSECNN